MVGKRPKIKCDHAIWTVREKFGFEKIWIMKFYVVQESQLSMSIQKQWYIYICEHRSIYNKRPRVYKLEDRITLAFLAESEKPTFDSKKIFRSRDPDKLEGLDLKNEKTKYNLFLLQFYFGGCDLTDLYYSKKYLRKR
jgi:hypothetical protein